MLQRNQNLPIELCFGNLHRSFHLILLLDQIWVQEELHQNYKHHSCRSAAGKYSTCQEKISRTNLRLLRQRRFELSHPTKIKAQKHCLLKHINSLKLDKGLTQDPDILLFLELYLKHGKLHQQQVLKDQNLRPWLSCACREEYCCFLSLCG